MFPARLAARRALIAAAAAAAAALLLAGCTAGGSSQSGSSSGKDSINYALPANFTPNWLLPIGTAAHLLAS